MPKYLIEGKVPAGKSAARTLKSMAGRAAPKLNLFQSYVTGDRCYCFYEAPSEKRVREHFRQSGFPVSRVSKVVSIIDPTKLAIIDPTKLAIIDPTKL